MATPKWKKFEELLAKIQKDFSPDAVVTLDDQIEGKITGAKRQVDISVRQTIGQYSILIAIDCKDQSKPVDVKGVEEVIGLIKDVGANKGAMVSSSGFTSTALTRGEKAGLDLLRLVDTGDHDWKAYAAIPILCHYNSLRNFSFTFTGTMPLILPSADVREIDVYGEEEDYIGKVGEILLEKFREGILPKDTGVYEQIDFIGEKTKVKYKDKFYPVTIVANINIESVSYFGNLELDEISGFKDEISGKLAFKRLKTSKFSYEDIEKNWKRIDPKEDLAIRPVLTFWLTN